MASEDFDQVGSGFLVIHRLCEFEDLNQTTWMKVLTFCHQTDALRERLEVSSFCSPKLVPLKERNDDVIQLTESSNVIPEQVFSVIVVSTIPINRPDPEEVRQRMQHTGASRALGDCESRVDLPAKSVSGAIDSSSLFYQAHREAPFAINETDHPVN